MSETLSQRYERFAARAVDLLAVGDAWPRFVDAYMPRFVGALVREFARVEESADTYRTEMDPSQTTALLPEWESALSLPEDCGAQVTTPGRRAAIIARLTGGGTNTLLALQAATAAFDADTALTSVSRESLFEMATGAMGDPVSGDEWAHTVTLHIETTNASLDEDGLECVLNGIRRAHGFYLFEHTLIVPTASYRVTHAGDPRVTQAGDPRITQGT